MSTLRVWTYLFGLRDGVIDAPVRISEDDESDRIATFMIGNKSYRVYVDERGLLHSKLVLFDGHLVPGGLPRGSSLVDYQYEPKTQKGFRFSHDVEEIDVTENADTVSDGPPARDHEYFERRFLVTATLKRNLLLLPIGHTAFGFRVKPRSLEREYISVEAKDTQVIFRTIVK